MNYDDENVYVIYANRIKKSEKNVLALLLRTAVGINIRLMFMIQREQCDFKIIV